MRRLALDKAKESVQQKELCLKHIERLTAALSERSSIHAQLAETTGLLARVAEHEADLVKKMEQIKQKAAITAQKKTAAEKIDYEKQHIQRMISDLTRQILEEATLFRHILSKARSCPVMFFEDERTALQEELKTMQVYAAQKIELTQAYSEKQETIRQRQLILQDEYKAAVETVQSRIQSTHTMIVTTEEKVNDLTQKKASLEEELMSIEREASSMRQALQTFSPDSLAAFGIALERRKGAYHAFVSKARGLQAQLTSVEHKKLLLHDNANTVCPLCEQAVQDARTLRRKFGAQESLLKHQLRRLEKITKSLKKIIDDDTSLAEVLTKKIEQQKALFIKIEEGEKIRQNIKTSSHV